MECQVNQEGACITTEENPWINYTLDEFWDSLGCDEIFQKERPIHSSQTWMFLRQTYQDIVGEQSTIAPLSSDNGFSVAFFASRSPGKGD